MAGPNFKVSLKGTRLGQVVEGDLDHQLPRAISCRMHRPPSVMVSQPFFEIIRYTHIPPVMVRDTDDEINVMHKSSPYSAILQTATKGILRSMAGG